MKLNKLFSIIAISVAAVSCSDFLNLSDPNAVTTANYYTSLTDIQNSVNGVYAVLKEGNFMGSSACYFEENKARFLTFPDTGVGGGENAQFDNCTVQAGNQMVLSRWNAIYKCIDRANVVLKHIDDIKYASADVRSQLEAEVRFVRALCYYTLVCDWGPVPVVLSKIETLDGVNKANVRQPRLSGQKLLSRWLRTRISLPRRLNSARLPSPSLLLHGARSRSVISRMWTLRKSGMWTSRQLLPKVFSSWCSSAVQTLPTHPTTRSSALPISMILQRK